MLDLRFRPLETAIEPPDGKFRRADFSASWGRTLDDIERELAFLGATDIVVEAGFQSNQIRNDGWPKGGASAWTPGIRLFFQSKHGPMRFECAAFDDWEKNVRAIGLVLQDLRLMKYRGVGSGSEQYRGYSALPPGGGIQAAEWATLEDAARFLLQAARMGDGASRVADVLTSDGELTDAYRTAARCAHPDAGGSNDLMAKVNRARDFIEGSRS